MVKTIQKLTPQQAKPKIEYYCNYQERCHQEVSNKLYEYGLNTDDVNLVLSQLVKSGLLNEERFAKAFASGKFRQKQWGKNKIRMELKSRNVTDFCIQKGLNEIDEEDYRNTVIRVAEKYERTLKDKEKFIRRQKILKYMVNRGFDYGLCMEMINEV